MNHCITPEQFQRLLAEQLNPAERQALEAHVEVCTPCEQMLARLLEDSPDGPAGVEGRLLRLDPSASTPKSAEDFLRRLKDNPPPSTPMAPGVPDDGEPCSIPFRITLTVTAGLHKGRVFTFVGHDTFIVGRSKRAHFQLPSKDKYFSRLHFLVEVNPPQCRLMDLGSRNGTYVNGQQVTTADLKNGDRIRAGRTILRVAVERTGALPATVSELLPPESRPAINAPGTPPTPARPPLVPPAALESGVPMPATQVFSGPGTEPCRVCGAAIPGKLITSGSQAEPGLPPLCWDCLDCIRNHPQPIKGYQIVRELGRGGMGVVYLALRMADGSRVALKTIIPAVASSRTQIQRFLREADILRELNHPHIVAFREMGESNNQLYFAMDFVPGTDAAQLLKNEGGPLATGRAVGLICQLLEALEYAHAKRFVHRDIKPANMLVTTAGGREVVQLADFGLARVYQASQLSGLTMMGGIGGTAAFLPPEQITNFREAKPPADQYSTAATLYNLLTDRFVYDLPPKVQDRLLMILHEDPVPIRSRRLDIPEGLAEIIHRSLAREPSARFATVRVMREALRRFCQ
jgi:serine/threonine-protein kinase